MTLPVAKRMLVILGHQRRHRDAVAARMMAEDYGGRGTWGEHCECSLCASATAAEWQWVKGRLTATAPAERP